MEIRELINRKPAVTAIVLLGLLCASMAFLVSWVWSQMDSPQPKARAYYYDQNTGELFALPADTIGPVETPSGPYRGMPAGVRAHVFSWGPYRRGSEKIIGWLQVPTDAVPADQRPAGVEANLETEEDDILIRRVEDDRWFHPNSPEGRLIEKEFQAKCPKGQRPNYLRPLPK